jgi:hypothetical protein
MTEKYICDKSRECKNKKCYHATPHISKTYCNSYCNNTPQKTPCISVEEIGYTLDENGTSSGCECPYNAGYIQITACNGCTKISYNSNPPKCQYFYGLDREKKVIWCAYKHFNHEVKMFKIGDKVKLISTKWGDSIWNPVWGGKCGRVEGKVAEVCGPSSLNPYYVKWDSGEGNGYREGDLELITEVKMGNKYEVIKEFTKYDYVIQHQKKYNWTDFTKSCAKFQEDMSYWTDTDEPFKTGYILYQKNLYSDNFYSHAVIFGFIREVKEDVYYHLGDHFRKSGTQYQLNSWGTDIIGLNSSWGSRYTDGLRTSNTVKIPASDFHNHFGKEMVKI